MVPYTEEDHAPLVFDIVEYAGGDETKMVSKLSISHYVHVLDGKWHHVTLSISKTKKKVELTVDGLTVSGQNSEKLGLMDASAVGKLKSVRVGKIVAGGWHNRLPNINALR